MGTRGARTTSCLSGQLCFHVIDWRVCLRLWFMTGSWHPGSQLSLGNRPRPKCSRSLLCMHVLVGGRSAGLCQPAVWWGGSVSFAGAGAALLLGPVGWPHGHALHISFQALAWNWPPAASKASHMQGSSPLMSSCGKGVDAGGRAGASNAVDHSYLSKWYCHCAV